MRALSTHVLIPTHHHYLRVSWAKLYTPALTVNSTPRNTYVFLTPSNCRNNIELGRLMGPHQQKELI